MRNLLPLFLLVSLREFRSRPLRSFIAVAGIALGVSLMVAVGTVNHSAIVSMEESTGEFLGRATLELSGGPVGVREELAKKVLQIPGVEAAASVIERGIYVQGEEEERLTILAIDLLDESSLKLYSPLASGKRRVIDDPLLFLSQPESLLLAREFAERHGYTEGAQLTAGTRHGLKSFRVSGLLDAQGASSVFGGNLAVMDLVAAQELLGEQGRVDRVELATRKGVSLERVSSELRRRFPRLTVRRTRSEAALFNRAAHSLAAVLGCLGLFTIVAGAFLIFSLAATIVAERQREVGIIRCLGGSRGSVILLFVAEGMLIGLLAAVAGTATGFAASRLAMRAFADRVATIASMPVGPLSPCFYWPAAAAGAASGLVASMLGFFLPAFFASQHGYAEASVVRCTSVAPPARWRGSPAGGLLAFVVALVAVGLEYKFSLGAIGPVSDAACVIGAALLLPRLVSALGSATEGMLERKMPTGLLLAARNVATASGSAATIAAVALAVCVIVVFATIQRSIGRSIGGWIEDSFVYDLEIASQSIDPGKLVPVHEDLAEGLASVRGVNEVHLVRWIQHDYKGHRVTIHSLDYSQSGRPTQRFMVRRGDPSGTYAEVAASRGVAVSENFALHLGVEPGDFISLKAPLGLARLKIVAVVVNYNSEEGTVLMSRALFDRYWGDRLVNYFLVMTAKSANLDEVRREIGRRFGREYDLVVLTLGEAKAKIYGIINRIFHFIYALEMLVVVVGFLTIASTVSASVVRRRQQLAICRSFGMSRGQLAGMIAAEAALMGLVSGAVGTILGLGLSVAWVKVHCSRLLGWIVNYSLPGLVIGATLVLTVMVAVIAGCWPAYEAGRIRAADYLRSP